MRIHHRAAALAIVATVAAAGPAAAQSGVGCVRTDAPPARVPGDTTVFARVEDIRRGMVFRCVLHRGHAAVRMVLRTDRRYNVPVDVQLFGSRSATRPRQVLVLDDANGPPRRGHRVLEGVDLNRDGWMDLKVLKVWGATGNEAFDVFLYSPARARFVRDTVLTDAGHARPIAGRPCVLTFWRMGPSSSQGEYCWRAQRWVLVHTEVVDHAGRDHGRYVRTVQARRGGRMRTVRVDTLDAAP
jgi:hypothetical protein